MSQTISQKILAEHAGLKRVEPGEIVKAKIDIAIARQEFDSKYGVTTEWEPLLSVKASDEESAF